jgi:mevalonate kinase
VAAKRLFRANGKVLISGEYLVLDGALALGMPLSLGQTMEVKESAGSDVVWESFLPNGEKWFTGKFDLFGFEVIKTTDPQIASTLSHIFEETVRLNSDFLSKWKKYTVRTYLDFYPDWGLGSSSSLISCLADWADVDPFELSENTFGGSGYDIACAKADGPILYQIQDEQRSVKPAPFSPSFSDRLYFIHLGQKQNSRSEIRHYESRKIADAQIDEISSISKSLCDAEALPLFEELINDHENLVSEIIGRPRVGKEKFNDYWGAIKSLGAWGGDFIMATSKRSEEETKAYFRNKGYEIVYNYDAITLKDITSSSPSLS